MSNNIRLIRGERKEVRRYSKELVINKVNAGKESKMAQKKKFSGIFSESKKLTVASSLDANSLNWLPSVFSSAWSYLAPCNFICPLKTSVAGLTCLLMVAFEAASLTGERDQMRVKSLIQRREGGGGEICQPLMKAESFSNRPEALFS